MMKGDISYTSSKPQRGFVTKPGVARSATPGKRHMGFDNPNGVAQNREIT
jgi:hypothetical protein